MIGISMDRRFSMASPFHYETAELIRGQFATVTTFDSGLTGTYQGIVTPIDKGKTKVGDEILMNDCIVAVKTPPCLV